MINTLTHTDFRPDGIFGEFTFENDPGRFCWTLEHAYKQADGRYQPIIIPGTYTCIRGPHRLHNMTHDFETFEIKGVNGHTNLLFHFGNFNRDSEGCVLVGRTESVDPTTGDEMITGSRDEFKAFMDRLEGIDVWTLTVE